MANNSKKGDVLKMLRFSLVTAAELTRFGNFQDKFSHVFCFWAKACILGTQKNRLDEKVLLSAENTHIITLLQLKTAFNDFKEEFVNRIREK